MDKSWLETVKTELGFNQLAWIDLKSPQTLDHYQQWINQGHHGEMTYLERHLPDKASPQRLLPGAQSVILVAKKYLPHPKPHGLFSGLRIAHYAQNFDYHDWFRKDLQSLADRMNQLSPKHQTLAGTDSMAFLERDYGQQAGLGWIGKNTCLIDRTIGSFFFIGEVLSTQSSPQGLGPADQVQDFCGTCNRCLEICPTQAIEAPRVLNAKKCISYWTIESKEIAPKEIRAGLNDWFFGCDLCQSICPWNQKPLKADNQVSPTESLLPQSKTLLEDLEWLLTSQESQIREKIKGTPFERSKVFGLRRNALYVIGNRKLSQAKPWVEKFTTDPKLSELALWTLARIEPEVR